jgi:uncharacterized protein YtpQ (UPF0354 family)
MPHMMHILRHKLNQSRYLRHRMTLRCHPAVKIVYCRENIEHRMSAGGVSTGKSAAPAIVSRIGILFCTPYLRVYSCLNGNRPLSCNYKLEIRPMEFLDKLQSHLTPSRDKFAQMLVERFKKANPGVSLRYDAADFCIRMKRGDGPESQHFLTTLYADYCRAGAGDRRRILDSVTATSTEVNADAFAPDWAGAKEHVLPRVRDRATYALLREKQGPGERMDFTDEPFSEHLSLELVYDFPNSIASVSGKQLAQWGVTRQEALTAARDNLWTRSNKDFKVIDKGLHISAWHDSYDASRLFLHDLIWQLDVRGDHVAMVPTRNHLIVTGSDDPAGLAAMANIAVECLADPRFLTGAAVRLERNKWVDYLPAADSAAYEPMRRAALLGFARDYQQQTELLQTALKDNPEETHIGRYLLFEEVGSKRISSKTLWIQGCRNMLPRADRIMFMARGGPEGYTSLGQWSWEAVQAHLGELLRPTDHYPPRFQTTEFPTTQQLQTLPAE